LRPSIKVRTSCETKLQDQALKSKQAWRPSFDTKHQSQDKLHVQASIPSIEVIASFQDQALKSKQASRPSFETEHRNQDKLHGQAWIPSIEVIASFETKLGSHSKLQDQALKS
jgi:hypothetical protein